MKKIYHNIKNCRICGFRDIILLLSLGSQPLANSLKKKPGEVEGKYPLTIVFCPRCSLVQLKETVKKEVLFDNYVWVTNTSEVTKKYAEIFYKRLAKITELKPANLVVEIASNDGTFLKPFINRGHNVVGVEPARNIAELARKSGVRTVTGYWGRRTVDSILSAYGKAEAVIARNVIPHVSGLSGAVEGIKRCLAESGTGVIEFHYAGKILQDLQYDSIYHEHLCYFSLKTIEHLFKKFGLFPFHADLSPISGGSYVIYFSKKKKRKKSSAYHRLKDKEKTSSVNRAAFWKKFSDKCIEHREESREMVKSLAGKTILAFGASARSSTYLNFCGFTNFEIKAIIDNNPLKQGLYSAGSSIPIVSIEAGLKMKPGILFITAWNFRDEIIKECKSKGYEGTYLVPFPNRPRLLKVLKNGKK